jgi:hypothetical protein
LSSKRIGKVKFAEAKIQKILIEIDRLEYSGLAINQILKVIRKYDFNTTQLFVFEWIYFKQISRSY